MNGIYGDILQSTISGLEDGLLVRHIATFSLQTCGVDDEVTKILSNPALKDFDQIPVKGSSQIVGILERKGRAISGPVRKGMRPLDDSILVTAEMPLTKFVPLVAVTQYRLVLRDAEIQGIVTRSDILKLPVRLLAFALVTHLEMVMADVIRTKCPDDQSWLAFLSQKRKGKLNEKLQNLKRGRSEPPLLGLTEFCDKRTILKKVCKLCSKFEDELEGIEKLRNKVAHAGDYAQNEKALRTFVERLRQAEHWIEQLSKDLNLSREERE